MPRGSHQSLGCRPLPHTVTGGYTRCCALACKLRLERRGLPSCRSRARTARAIYARCCDRGSMRRSARRRAGSWPSFRSRARAVSAGRARCCGNPAPGRTRGPGRAGVRCHFSGLRGGVSGSVSAGSGKAHCSCPRGSCASACPGAGDAKGGSRTR